MTTIGQRLKEERERLALSQTAMAEAGGTTKKTQIDYETDRTPPKATYLAAVAACGLDVTYVVLGERQLAVRVGADELPVLDKYRHARPDLQEAVRRLLGAPPDVQKALVTVITKSTI